MLCPKCQRRLRFCYDGGELEIAANGRLMDEHGRYVSEGWFGNARVYCPRCGDVRYDDHALETAWIIKLCGED